MITSRKRMAYKRAGALLSSDRRHDTSTLKLGDPQDVAPLHFLEQLLLYSKSSMKLNSFLLTTFIAALVMGTTSAYFLVPAVVPLFAVLGFVLPFVYLKRKAAQRASAFLDDYPSVLMATASSVKAGLPPISALSRAVELLPQDSICRKETEDLVRHLNSGMPKRKALSLYGNSIALPALELFRSSFQLVLDSGGRFSPTLFRLAEIASDTSIMMKEARVATASMRMTGNVLLCVIPVILGTLSLRNAEYWQTLLTHPTAQVAASLGALTIVVGCLSLRIMSNFKA